jgi:hypothetical protein
MSFSVLQHLLLENKILFLENKETTMWLLSGGEIFANIEHYEDFNLTFNW